jgi:hypothetical protein
MYVVQSLPKFLLADSKVRSLIDNLSKWWNEHLIHSIFCKEEAEKILSVPLSKYGQCDLMIWRDSSTWTFTVRSAYHIERDIQEVKGGECSYSSKVQDLWKVIWGLKVPNPVKKILWCACHNILPTTENLIKKGMDVDPLCIFCKFKVEVIKHILWDCPSANDVWGGCGKSKQKSVVAGDTFIELLEYILKRCTTEDFELHVEVA